MQLLMFRIVRARPRRSATPRAIRDFLRLLERLVPQQEQDA